MSAVAYRLTAPQELVRREPYLQLLDPVPAHRSTLDLVYRRRRILVGTVAALLVGLMAVATVLLARAPATPSRAVAPMEATANAGTEWVVQPGDTLWSIATAAHPSRDPRPLVTSLMKQRKGTPLQVGERIVLPD